MPPARRKKVTRRVEKMVCKTVRQEGKSQTVDVKMVSQDTRTDNIPCSGPGRVCVHDGSAYHCA